MGKTSNLEENLSEKGKKARRRLEATNCEIEWLNVYLRKISGILTNVIKNLDGVIEETGKKDAPGSKNEHPQKKRSMIEQTPTRIQFTQYQLKFYIDFTQVAMAGDDPTNIMGSIVYGTSRSLCFADCVFPEEAEACHRCDRIARCDGLEDKPLIQFLVDKHGMVKSGRELEDEWWIEDPAIENDKGGGENWKALGDLHYRALAHIWKDALDWTNENVLP